MKSKMKKEKIGIKKLICDNKKEYLYKKLIKNSIKFNLNKNHHFILLLFGLIQLCFFFYLSKEETFYYEIKTYNTKGKQKLVNGFFNLMFVNNVSLIGDDEDYFNLTEDMNEIIIKYRAKQKNCDQLFNGLSHITKIDFSNFDSSAVTSMKYMFSNCDSLTSIDFTNFNTSLVTNMTGMFYNCPSLISINLGNFNTNSVIFMDHMFYECGALELLDLSSFNTSSVKNMASMFRNCVKLTTLIINNFNTSLVESMYYMFSKCTLLKTLNIDNFNTISVKNMEAMFYDCNNLITLNLYNFDTSSVTTMKGMFYNCYLLTSLNISNFNTILVENFAGMFANCTELKSLDVNSFNTSSAIDMEFLFYNCTNLKILDLRKFNTSSVIKMNHMFSRSARIQYIFFGNFFITSHVESMEQMFFSCMSLRTLDLSNFDTSSVTSMNSMFRACRSLTSLNLNSFYTPSLENMYNMFNYCDKLESLEINNFNTELVTNMKGLFDLCPKLTSLNLYNFNTLNLNPQYSSIFTSTNIYSELIFCIKKDITLSNIQNLLMPYISNCSYFCFKQEKKYILQTEECIDNCTNSPYKYEYKSRCYDSCPDDVYYNYEKTGCIDKIPNGYYLYDENQKTIDKCINNCSNCTDIIFCTSCNNEDGFYPLFNDSQNVGSSIKCYKEVPEAHFLDINEKIFMPCYPVCKECEELGNDTNNKCTDCYSDKILSEGNCLENCLFYFYYDSFNSFQCTTEKKCPNESNLLIEEKKQCIDSCEKSDFKYEFNYSCYKNCPNGTHISKNNNYLCEENLICNNYYNYNQTECIDEIPEGFYLNDSYHNTIDKCDIKCKNCSKESELNNLCISCNNYDNYYPKFDDNNLFINCFNGIQDGYYFDNNEHIYIPCYSTCKKCNEFGNIKDNKCLECYSNYIKINNNCYNKCNFFYFFNFLEEYQCTQFNFCPDDYDKLIKEKNQCIDDCNKDNIYKYEYNKICYIKCPDETKISNNNICIEKLQCNDYNPYLIIETGECSKNCSAVNFFNYICKIYSDNPKYEDKMINTIRNDILNDNMDELIYSKVIGLNNDLNVYYKNKLFQITSSYNQNNNKNMNISTIKLGDCENILKKHYNLNDDEDFIIFKIEIYIEGFLIPIIEYEIFSLSIKEKLDLNLCNETKININNLVNIDEKYLFKYNSTDDFYTDKCYPFTTESNTDITLDDRKNEFINNNMSLCEINCIYKGYNVDTKQAECDCQFKSSIALMDGFVVINKDLLLNNFKDIKKSMNLFVYKCYYIFFTNDGFLYNIGSYILLIIILFEIFSLFSFLLKGYQFLLNRFHNFYLKLNNI